MSYMEQAMQTQIDGAIALQNQICDEACEVYKEIHLTPRQLLQQRAELLDITRKFVEASNKSRDVLEFSVMCDEFISEASEAIQKAEQ